MSRTWSARLKNVTDGNYKFWDCDLDGRTVTTRYGAIGTDGVTVVKNFDSSAKAGSYFLKKQSEKFRKGYVGKDPVAKVCVYVLLWKYRFESELSWRFTGAYRSFNDAETAQRYEFNVEYQIKHFDI